MDQKMVLNGIVAVIAGIVIQIAVLVWVASKNIQIAVPSSLGGTTYYYAADWFSVLFGMLLGIFGNLLLTFAVVYLTMGLRGDGSPTEMAA